MTDWWDDRALVADVYDFIRLHPFRGDAKAIPEDQVSTFIAHPELWTGWYNAMLIHRYSMGQTDEKPKLVL